MGGHGGLNILPQKRWNVYNYENREKVRKDEEAAAREEQLRLEQSRRRDAEHRLERLRNARGVPSPSPLAPPSSDSHHINLFDGVPGFSSLASARSEKEDPKKSNEEGRDPKNSRKRRREERPPTVGPEDEKYKLGYGLAGKGVKAPWYLSKPSAREEVDEENDGKGGSSSGSGKKSGGGKKTIEELREERMKRERQEKERERALLSSVGKKGADRGSSRR